MNLYSVFVNSGIEYKPENKRLYELHFEAYIAGRIFTFMTREEYEDSFEQEGEFISDEPQTDEPSYTQEEYEIIERFITLQEKLEEFMIETPLVYNEGKGSVQAKILHVRLDEDFFSENLTVEPDDFMIILETNHGNCVVSLTEINF